MNDPELPRGARHRRTPSRDRQGGEDLHPRRLRRDGPAARRVLRLRQLRGAPAHRPLRAQRGRPEGGRLLRRISRDALAQPLRVADHRVGGPDDEQQSRTAVELGPLRSRRSVDTVVTELGVETRHRTRHRTRGPARAPARSRAGRCRRRCSLPHDYAGMARDGARNPSRRSPRRLGAVRAAAAHLPARRDQGQRPE